MKEKYEKSPIWDSKDLEASYDVAVGRSGPKRLPKIDMDGTEYFIDGRLQEIRAVDDFEDRLGFDEIDMIKRFADFVERKRERLE